MSSNEATKSTPAPQPYPPTYPPFSGPYPPPGAYSPPFYTYAPPPDGHGENGGQPGHHPYMMAYPPPPGMVYAYPPPGQSFYQGESNGKHAKRKQVKMACTNCAAACKRCDESRPCERCIKYGQADQCHDGIRKARKKGIKRGPYKRKHKSDGSSEDTAFASFPQQSTKGDTAESPDWQPASPPRDAGQATTSSAPPSGAIHAVAPYPGPPPPIPEGYYPYYYPPSHGFMPPPPPPPGQEGHADSSQVQPGPNAVIQYFSVHPGGYAPFPYPSYPPQQHPGAPPQPQQQQTMDPKKVNAALRQESEEETEEEESSPVPPILVPVQVSVPAPAPTPPSKKRSRTLKTGGSKPKSKKIKLSKTSKKASKLKAVVKEAANDGLESDVKDLPSLPPAEL